MSTMVQPVILSGGSGTRLWPLSRGHYPKQLLPLAGEHSMLQQTALRVRGIDNLALPVVVCNEEHRFLVAQQLVEIAVKAASILLEPEGRNTAPALTLAALAIRAGGDDPLMLVMPADHVIRDETAFRTAVAVGRPLAEAGELVTFGIVPATPETGYGYILRGEALSQKSSTPAHRVARFVEKPDRTKAEQYLASGDYYWNSGMFLLRTSVWLEEIERHRPHILDACRQAYGQGRADMDFYRVDATAFRTSPGDSIDYAVMEKTNRAAVVPLDAGWSDVGSWSSLWEVGERDGAGNVVRGDVMVRDTRNALVMAQHRFVATIGIDDIVVVETADSVLVAHRDRAQQVKDIVADLKKHKRPEHLTHRRVHRPWGSYEGVDVGERFQVKRITVNPGAALSLQMHHHRAEHWIVVKGTAKVTRGDQVFVVGENESTFIPLGVKHRLENSGPIPLEIIEVQSGGYLGEDDIVRFDDSYNRHN